MSRIVGRDAKDMMEAYAAVYAPQEQSCELVEQVIDQQEDFELDPDALLECVKEYLVTERYAKGEKEAIDMLPHLGENFLHNICTHIIINEVFYQNVNSLVEEGYDLSEYTWNELFESYVDGLGEETLNEAIPLAIPAAGAAAPYVLPAIGAAAYGLKGLMGMRNKSQAQTDAAAEKFLSKKEPLKAKPKPQGTTQRTPAPAAQQTKPPVRAVPTGTRTPAQRTGSTGATPPAGGSGGGGNQPPKPPKIDPLKTLKDIGTGVGKAFRPGGPVRQAVKQTLGKPARERFFGTTRAGQITRGATAAGTSALDIAGKAFDPSKPSAVSTVGSLGPGAVGTSLQGTGNIPGIKGTSLGTGARGTGEYLRQLGRDMRDQPEGKPPWKYGQKTQSMRGFQ